LLLISISYKFKEENKIIMEVIMKKKKMILFGDNVDTIIFWNELLEGKVDFLSFVPDSIAGLYDSIEEIIDFKPEIVVFIYPGTNPLGEEIRRKISQLLEGVEMKYFQETKSISEFFQAWGIEIAKTA
jgi:hypothetical protein